jgi:carboxylesterase
MLRTAVSFPLDPARTAPFLSGPGLNDTDAAVLVLHGFTGSPWDVRPLGDSLAQRGFHVHGPRLPGHGTVPEDLLWVTWRDWGDAAEQALKELDGFRHVFIAGLSMGGLLGLILAARRPERVKGLALLAPAVKVQQPIGKVLQHLRHLQLPLLRMRWLEKGATDIEDEEALFKAPVLARYPLARLFDLFTLQDVMRESLPLVRAPSLVVAARKDRVIDLKSVEALHRSLPQSRLLLLQRGRHIIPRDRDRALACSEVAEFFDGLRR